MNPATAGWTFRERVLLALSVAALVLSAASYVDLGGSATADPFFGEKVTSSDIANNTIKSKDVLKLTASDLGVYVKDGSAVTVPARQGTTSGVSCNSGDRAIAGGFNSWSTVRVTASIPTSTPGTNDFDKWIFAHTNDGSYNAQFTPIAVCMND